MMVAKLMAVVDHDDSYTWNLVHLIGGVTGVPPTVINHRQAQLDDLTRFSHLVLSPGPGAPHRPGDFALGPGVFELPVAILGVCLGMQAMVWAHGGRVEAVDPAHGEPTSVTHTGHPTFANVPSTFTAVRYHSLAATSVPTTLIQTAWCGDAPRRVTMAVAHRTKPMWGVQFHPESILTEYGNQLITNFLSVEP